MRRPVRSRATAKSGIAPTHSSARPFTTRKITASARYTCGAPAGHPSRYRSTNQKDRRPVAEGSAISRGTRMTRLTSPATDHSSAARVIGRLKCARASRGAMATSGAESDVVRMKAKTAAR